VGPQKPLLQRIDTPEEESSMRATHVVVGEAAFPHPNAFVSFAASAAVAGGGVPPKEPQTRRE
jgi:hypothetical protein